jgi:hypothetical protein
VTPALFVEAVDLRGMIVKVIAQEVIGFGLAFALSLAASITAVELVWHLI